MALLEKAAGQGHVYAMHSLRSIHDTRKEYEQAMKWITQGAEAGLPKAMFNLGVRLDSGQGVAAPDYPAAASWYRRAADAGSADGAYNLSHMYTVGRGWARQIMPAASMFRIIIDPNFLTQMAAHDASSNVCQTLDRGVTRSKRRAQEWMRKAAEAGNADACFRLAVRMYRDEPYACEVGHVAEAAGLATSAGVMEGYDVPQLS